MSSKKRTPMGRTIDAKTGQSDANVSQTPNVNMGNQAEINALSNTERAKLTAEFSLLTDSARPLFQHSMMAIQIDENRPAQGTRLRSIIERSNLPHEQKHRLLADMSVKETQSNAVSKGLTQYFGEDSESLREALWACMYQCVQESNNESAVSHGSLWQTEQGAVIQLDAIDASHSLTHNTDILIERFAEHFSGQSLRDRFAEPQQAGLAIRQFCRSLYLAIQLEDEEEEEAWSIPDME